MNRFAFLRSDVSFHHLVRDGTGTDREISSRPHMPAPHLLSKMRKLLKEYPRTDPLQPLNNSGNILVRSVSDQNVNVVARYLPRQNHYLVFHCYLPDQVAHTYRHIARQDLLPIFRKPDQVDFQVVFRVRAYLVPFHATTLHEPSRRLKARDFHHPGWRH